MTASLRNIPLSFALDPFAAQTLYVGTSQGVLRSRDDGESWVPLPTGAVRVERLAADPTRPGTLLASFEGEDTGLHRSVDGGANWTRAIEQEDLPVRALAFDASEPAIVYASHFRQGFSNPVVFVPASSTLFRSEDGGLTWTSIYSNLRQDTLPPFGRRTVNAVAPSPAGAEIIYIATAVGVFKTTNAGESWFASSEGLPRQGVEESSPIAVQDLAIDPQRPERLWAATSEGLHRSLNAALTWTQVDLGLDADSIGAVSLDPSDGDRVWATLPPSNERNAFVTKLSADLDAIEFSAVLGGSGEDEAVSLAVSAEGEPILLGTTESPDFPLVAAVDPYLGGENELFLARLTADGGELRFSTYLGGELEDRPGGLALDQEGAIWIAGETFSPDFPGLPPHSGDSDGFVLRLSADGSRGLMGARVGGWGEDAVHFMTVDDEGRLYVLGETKSPNLPTTEGGTGCNRLGFLGGEVFFARLNTGSGRVERSIRWQGVQHDFSLGAGIAPSSAPNHGPIIRALVYGLQRTPDPAPGIGAVQGGVFVLPLDYSGPGPDLAVPCAVNAASLIAGPVAPGELITFYGKGLGGETFVVADPSEGRLPFELDGVRVFFDGEPAPLVHVQNGQLSAVVPTSIADKDSVEVTVESNGARAVFRRSVLAAHPGIFTQNFNGIGSAVFNQDGTLNSRENYAPSGTIVSLYITGAGLLEPSVDAAGIASGSTPPAQVKLPVTATISGLPAPVVFAGQSPGQPNAVVRVDVVAPREVSARTPSNDFRIFLTVGEWKTQEVDINIDPEGFSGP